MSAAHDLRTLPPPSRERLGSAFALGRPATRLEAIAGGLVSFWDLYRPRPTEPRPPILATLAKLTVWVVAAIGLAAAGGVAVGALVVRIYTATFG
jgi:hypothetical protein